MRGVMDKDLIQVGMIRSEYYGYLDQTAHSKAYCSDTGSSTRRRVVIVPCEFLRKTKLSSRVLVMGME